MKNTTQGSPWKTPFLSTTKQKIHENTNNNLIYNFTPIRINTIKRSNQPLISEETEAHKDAKIKRYPTNDPHPPP